MTVSTLLEEEDEIHQIGPSVVDDPGLDSHDYGDVNGWYAWCRIVAAQSAPHPMVNQMATRLVLGPQYDFTFDNGHGRTSCGDHERFPDLGVDNFPCTFSGKSAQH